ncbi:hypothetical protein BGZ63DRAFT_422113 [Mariannaea sp. PMI_226]|nr:hypothetical protein BGZ63DRAFT_422113 [Mariannaea sp. PMI_226]
MGGGRSNDPVASPGALGGAHLNEGQDCANVAAMQVQTVKTDNQDPTLELDWKSMFKQPDTRPLTSEEMKSELRGIYAGLEPVEEACIHWAKKLATSAIDPLDAKQYATLIALYRTLLHEHIDFLMASQQPIASPELKSLAAKYDMPARMWKHAIHSFLGIMHKRLFECQEFMDSFIIQAYLMISLLDETIPGLRSTWIECKAELARYVYAITILKNDTIAGQCWRDVSREDYTRVLVEKPTEGRIYHHLAILERPRPSLDKDFNAIVSQLFYFTKSLVVETPFFTTRDSIWTIINIIIARTKEPASIPQTDEDHFLTAAVHLILASLEPKALRKYGHKDTRNHHLQAVYNALEEIKIDGPYKTSRIHPTAKLGQLLCQLLLGIPLGEKKRSPMMAALAPDFVMAEEIADSDAMANARDIHDATIELINTMIPYLLEKADTRDLGVWGFIYIILVFMRPLETRPALRAWFGSAFHARTLAPFLNMLLREDETRGGLTLKSTSQSELVTVSSLLNDKPKPGMYGFSTEDNIRKYYHREQESTTTTEETAISNAAHKRDRDTETPVWEQMYANVLPEHILLSGLFVAREAELCKKSPKNLTNITVKAEERPLFPKNWFECSKHSIDEAQVRNHVQDAETHHDRSMQILRLVAQLRHFFIFITDEDGRYWISVPGASSTPKPDPNKKMPEIIERDSGVRIVYVHPSALDPDDEPISACEMELGKVADIARSAAEKPLSTHDTETTVSVQGSETGLDSFEIILSADDYEAAATVPAEDSATKLTKDMLNKIPENLAMCMERWLGKTEV